MKYLFKGKVVAGETMQETAEVEKLFHARNDEEARKVCKDLSKQHILFNGEDYQLYKEIPIEINESVYDH